MGIERGTSFGAEFGGGHMDFSQKPQNLAKMYRFGEPVTRDNFAAFVTDSFRRSRGVAPAQNLYIAYLNQTLESCPVTDICREFLDQGGWQCLAYDEQQLLYGAYRRARHEEGFSGEIDDFGKKLIDEFSEVLPGSELSDKKFRKMSPKEFLKYMNSFIEKEQDVREHMKRGVMDLL